MLASPAAILAGMKIKPTEAVFEYVLPVVGIIVTFTALRVQGVSRGWAIALAVPGALGFQLGVVLLLAALAHWLDRRE